MSGMLRWTPEQYAEHLAKLNAPKLPKGERLSSSVPTQAEKREKQTSIDPAHDSGPEMAEVRSKLMDAKAAVRALGRLPRGVMNKTEAAYEKTLAERKRAGEIVWYAFEMITFVLPGGVRYTPDFMVQLASGEVEIHEVKGFWEEDARQKIKIAQGIFPFRFWGIKKRAKKDGGGWDFEDFWK